MPNIIEEAANNMLKITSIIINHSLKFYSGQDARMRTIHFPDTHRHKCDKILQTLQSKNDIKILKYHFLQLQWEDAEKMSPGFSIICSNWSVSIIFRNKCAPKSCTQASSCKIKVFTKSISYRCHSDSRTKIENDIRSKHSLPFFLSPVLQDGCISEYHLFFLHKIFNLVSFLNLRRRFERKNSCRSNI